jgi:hypothetical protein
VRVSLLHCDLEEMQGARDLDLPKPSLLHVSNNNRCEIQKQYLNVLTALVTRQGSNHRL